MFDSRRVHWIARFVKIILKIKWKKKMNQIREKGLGKIVGELVIFNGNKGLKYKIKKSEYEDKTNYEYINGEKTFTSTMGPEIMARLINLKYGPETKVQIIFNKS